MSEWRCSVSAPMNPAINVRLFVYRTWGPKTQWMILGGENPSGGLGETDPDMMPPDEWGLLVPREVLPAVSEALLRTLGPSPETLEAQTLREALEVERGRVDRVIDMLPLTLPGAD